MTRYIINKSEQYRCGFILSPEGKLDRIIVNLEGSPTLVKVIDIGDEEFYVEKIRKVTIDDMAQGMR